MNVVHLHLLINHVPVIGAIFGTLLLLFALARRSDELTKAALLVFGLIGVLSVVVFLTGGAAEDAAERLPGFSKALTERHEEAAMTATIMMAVLGGLALVALWVYRRRALPRGLISTALIAAVAVTTMMGFAANLGGQIRHPEIRSASAAGEIDQVRPTDRDRERDEGR